MQVGPTALRWVLRMRRGHLGVPPGLCTVSPPDPAQHPEPCTQDMSPAWHTKASTTGRWMLQGLHGLKERLGIMPYPHPWRDEGGNWTSAHFRERQSCFRVEMDKATSAGPSSSGFCS